MRIIHIADVHWRGLTRHTEYQQAFESFYAQAKELMPDCIVIAGDLWHTKTQGITPEAIDAVSTWLTEMSKICILYVTLGNHDGNLYNKTRQDAISPIINALHNDRIRLFKESGTYQSHIPGFNFCVFSCFDEEGWDRVVPVPGETNIAIFHGGVVGSQTDADWNISGHQEVSFFERFDFALLGDIHKMQSLALRDVELEIDENDLHMYPDAIILEAHE